MAGARHRGRARAPGGPRQAGRCVRWRCRDGDAIPLRVRAPSTPRPLTARALPGRDPKPHSTTEAIGGDALGERRLRRWWSTIAPRMVIGGRAVAEQGQRACEILTPNFETGPPHIAKLEARRSKAARAGFFRGSPRPDENHRKPLALEGRDMAPHHARRSGGHWCALPGWPLPGAG